MLLTYATAAATTTGIACKAIDKFQSTWWLKERNNASLTLINSPFLSIRWSRFLFWLTPIHQSNIGFKPAPICFLWYLTIIKRQLWYPFVSKLFFAPHAFITCAEVLENFGDVKYLFSIFKLFLHDLQFMMEDNLVYKSGFSLIPICSL